jgi:hypothetical protein
MPYTTRPAYESLCATARARGYTLSLSRLGEAWGLQVVVPAATLVEWRAAGAIFPHLEMLESEAAHLLLWIGKVRGL